MIKPIKEGYNAGTGVVFMHENGSSQYMKVIMLV